VVNYILVFGVWNLLEFFLAYRVGCWFFVVVLRCLAYSLYRSKMVRCFDEGLKESIKEVPYFR
jgi:hypothetical protein